MSSGRSGAVDPAETVVLAQRLARLGDLVLYGDLPVEVMRRLETSLEGALAECTAAGQAQPFDASVRYAQRSPFVGRSNVRAPGMRFERIEGDDSALRGLVELSPAFAGPTGYAHGGVVTGLIDELAGSLVSVVDDGGGQAVTATLDTRFRKPTPIGAELVLEARVVRRSSRRIRIEAFCQSGGEITVSAEALMVVVP